MVHHLTAGQYGKIAVIWGIAITILLWLWHQVGVQDDQADHTQFWDELQDWMDGRKR